MVVVMLAGCVFVVVDRAQAKICQPGAHGNLGCLDIIVRQPGKPAEKKTPTATATQMPTPTRTPSPTPNICSIRGCE